MEEAGKALTDEELEQATGGSIVPDSTDKQKDSLVEGSDKSRRNLYHISRGWWAPVDEKNEPVPELESDPGKDVAQFNMEP